MGAKATPARTFYTPGLTGLSEEQTKMVLNGIQPAAYVETFPERTTEQAAAAEAAALSISDPNAYAPDPYVNYVVEVSTVSKNGPWTKLGETAATSIVDSATSLSSPRAYRVRTRALRYSGSGTYYNLSQGAFWSNIP